MGTKMYQEAKYIFWWHKIKNKNDIIKYIMRYLIYQQVKVVYQRPSDQLSAMKIYEYKQKEETIDFVKGLPKIRRKYDAICKIVHTLTKSTYFLAIRAKSSLESLTNLYISKVVFQID